MPRETILEKRSKVPGDASDEIIVRNRTSFAKSSEHRNGKRREFAKSTIYKAREKK